VKICHNDSNPPRDRVSALGFHGELRNPFEQNLVVDQSLQEESGHEDSVLLTTGTNRVLKLVAPQGRLSISAITRSRSPGVSTAKNGELCRSRWARELVETRRSLTRSGE